MQTNRSLGETLNSAIAKAIGQKEPRHGRATAAGGFQTGWKEKRRGAGKAAADGERIYDKCFIVVSAGKVKLHRKRDGQDATKCLTATDSGSFDQIRTELKKHFGIELPNDWHK